jgi:hypothetical protein
MITPSEEQSAGGKPVFFRVSIGDELFAYLCCGDNGWRDRDTERQSQGLVDAIGKYLLGYYE